MLRDMPVGDLMSTDVVTFNPDDDVREAMRTLLRREVDAGPVLDADGKVVGVLSTADLIVEEARVHLPTVVTLLGAYLELPRSKRRFDEEMEKALGSTVGEVMDTEVVTVSPTDTVEDVASVLHERNLDRLPVVDGDGRLVGILARGDIIRAMVRELDAADGAAAAPGGDGE